MVDNWMDSPEAECCVERWTRLNLTEGEYYFVRLDYLELQGNAGIQFLWSTGGGMKSPVPTESLFRGATLANGPFPVEVIPGNASSVSYLLNPPETISSAITQRFWIEARDTCNNTVT
jgi:hypothetical protein